MQTNPQKWMGFKQSCEEKLYTFLPYMPLTLFFPVGFMYTAWLIFLGLFFLSGNFKQKAQHIKQHPMFLPVVFFAVFVVVMAFLNLVGVQNIDNKKEGVVAFFHYQIYVFLLPFMALDKDNAQRHWQQKSIWMFFLASFIAATFLYVNHFWGLPATHFFRSYTLYEGNKSILIGLLLAISLAWMLHDAMIHKKHWLLRVVLFVYVGIALISFSKSRTAALLFLILLTVWVVYQMSWRVILPLLFVFVSVVSLWLVKVVDMPPPVTCLAKDMQAQYHMSGLEILKNRAICSVHQIKNFSQSQEVTEDGMRLQIYKNTWEMIQDKPLLGHGMGTWVIEYPQKAAGQVSEKMTTPHNDYLLYWFELGLGGLLGLLWLLAAPFFCVFKMRRTPSQPQAVYVLMIGVSIVFVGLFNAALRDALFGLAFLGLMGIGLAGMQKENAPSPLDAIRN